MSSDRNEILARRQRFIQAALAGLVVGGCSGPAPQPCLEIVPTQIDTDTDTDAPAPQPCLKKVVQPLPAPCLDFEPEEGPDPIPEPEPESEPAPEDETAPEPVPDPIPRPCLNVPPMEEAMKDLRDANPNPKPEPEKK